MYRQIRRIGPLGSKTVSFMPEVETEMNGDLSNVTADAETKHAEKANKPPSGDVLKSQVLLR